MTKAKYPPDRFDAVDEQYPRTRMVYNIIIELYDPDDLEPRYISVRAKGVEDAEEIALTVSASGYSRGVSVVPDVFEYLRRYHPGCLESINHN